ncbi:MAG: hypothetical protein U1F46_03400 [Marinagarivorans sp.]
MKYIRLETDNKAVPVPRINVLWIHCASEYGSDLDQIFLGRKFVCDIAIQQSSNPAIQQSSKLANVGASSTLPLSGLLPETTVYFDFYRTTSIELHA